MKPETLADFGPHEGGGRARSPGYGLHLAAVNDDECRFSKDEAAAALERAAQLQLAAAERAEHAADGDTLAHDGFARDELVEAAQEAGIDARYLALALREQQSVSDDEALAKLQASDVTMKQLLGTLRRSVSVSRVIEADGPATLEACRRVLEVGSPKLELSLVRISEEHPLEGGWLEYSTPRITDVVRFKGRHVPWMLRLGQLDAWTLRVTFRPQGGRTQVTIQGELSPGVHANLRLARRSIGVGAVLGAVVTSGVAIGAGVPGVLVFGLGLLGAVVVGGVFGGLYRALYVGALRVVEPVLEALLRAVVTRSGRHEPLDDEHPALSPSDT